MRFLNRLLVFLFVRRKAQAHARAVLDDKRRQRAVGKQPAAATTDAESATEATPPTTATATADDAAAVPVPADAEPGAVVALPASPRETLIQEALAARKRHEAEWDALTPAQQSRAIASLGEGMAAIVKTFRAA